MYFIASKLLWFAFAPSHLVAGLVVASAVAAFVGLTHIARGLIGASAILFALLGIMPTGIWLLRPIEDEYARPEWPRHVDGVLILGGGMDPAVLASRNLPTMECSETRVVAGYELARRYPNARVIFSGGSALLGKNHPPEAAVAGYVFSQLGLPAARVTLESKSRNTWENIIFSQRIAKPRLGEVWLLVTSAFHMPRAVEAAQRAGWKVVPWPTDYLTMRSGASGYFDVPHNLALADLAVHEWIGQLAYR